MPVETFIKEYLEAKQSKKRKGSWVPEIPNKPNRKTRLTNQLRLNSKALFDPSLKEKNPIVIEYEKLKRTYQILQYGGDGYPYIERHDRGEGKEKIK
jgi:hypothetical protein